MHASLRVVSLTVGLAAASVCSAQTTPEEFFEELQTFYSMNGTPLSFESQSKDGDVLVLTGMALDMSQPEFSMKITLGDMRIAPIDDPDYDLEMIIPPTVPITMTVSAQGIEASATGTVAMNGSYKIGGTSDERVLNSDVESFNFVLEDITIPDTDIPPFDATMTGSNIAALVRYSLADARFSSTVTADDVSFAGNISVEGNTFDLGMTIRDSATTSSGPIVDGRDTLAVFGSAVPFETKATDGGVELTVTGTGEVPFSFAMATSSSEVEAIVGKGGIDVSGVLKGYDVSVSSPMMPIPPVNVKADTYGFRIALPLVPYGETGVTALRLNLDGLTVSEALWSLFDPAQAIPRDPATVLIDVTSASNALIDITDPVAQMGLAGMPLRFDDVKLNDLRIAIGGAEITGEGAAEIANDGPFPIPVGGADFRITGINGLIEKLIGIGLLQPEQAMPAQMMLGMFAKPGDEPDVFTSRVEMGADGSITANGIPLQ